MEDKKIIIEELNRIKNLMGYNRSKTLNENINEVKYGERLYTYISAV